MGTPFTDIYDQFLMLVRDYRLVELYNASQDNFNTYLSGWLIPAITDFKNCNQSLTYSSLAFTEILTTENIKILALLMKRYWLKQEIENITQMSLHVQDRDFKTFAEANNLQQKEALYQADLEEVSQMLVDYGLNNVNWSSWLNGVFFVP